MAFSKIVFNGDALMDVTQDSVTAETLMEGETAHDASGERITGTATGGGGGSSERFMTPSMPEYALNGNSTIKLANHNYATVRIVGDVGGEMRITTSKHYFLSSLTNAETGGAVPYTTVSEDSRGGEYTFTMPDADVTYELYYDD